MCQKTVFSVMLCYRIKQILYLFRSRPDRLEPTRSQWRSCLSWIDPGQGSPDLDYLKMYPEIVRSIHHVLGCHAVGLRMKRSPVLGGSFGSLQKNV